MSVGRLSCLLVMASAAACGPQLPPPPRIEGPACAGADAAAFAGLGRPLKTAQFNDVTFRRRSGHVSCKAYDRATICHLSSPGLLHVNRGGQDWWFNPGSGERVVLVVAEGRPRCVIDGSQSVEDWAKAHMGATCGAARIKHCP